MTGIANTSSPFVGMSTVQPVRHDVWRHEISCNEGCGWRQVMQEGEFHCHAFSKEKKSLNLGGASCSISSRNVQLVSREPSQDPVPENSPPSPPSPLCLSLLHFPHSTTAFINQILAQNYTPLRDVVQGDGVIKGRLLKTRAQKQVQSKKPTKRLEGLQ